MRYIRNDDQTPKRLVPPEKRKTLVFFILQAGVAILIAGTSMFFASFFFRSMIEARWDISYRTAQSYSLVLGGIGIVLYIITGYFLKVPLGKTTYYKVTTIMKNEPFDPPRKGDFSKAIFARLRDLDDDWAFFTEVVPPESEYKLPQVLVGPGGVFATCPVNEFPDRRAFKDPGPDMESASRKLGGVLKQQVTPILVFSTPKLVSIYKGKHEAKTRVMHIKEISDYFAKRKGKLNSDIREDIEAKVFTMIRGTKPGSK